MNNLIAEIQSYPFERLRKLISPKKSPAEINLSIGEPKHPASPKILDAINQNKELFSHYPPMAMVPDRTRPRPHAPCVSASIRLREAPWD